VTLFAMGMRSDAKEHLGVGGKKTEGKEKAADPVRKVKFRLSHHYIAPPTTESERQEVFAQFNKRFNERMAEAEAEIAAAEAADGVPMADALPPKAEGGAASPSAAAGTSPQAVPSDQWSRPERKRVLLYCPAQMLQSPAIPDEFYEI